MTALTIALPPQVTASALSAPGLVQFNAGSITGLTYVVETASNLANPLWIPVQTNNTGPGGNISLQGNSTSPNLFFRLLFP